MDQGLLSRIRTSLRSKRDNLSDWVQTAQPEELENALGPVGLDALDRHIEIIDTVLEKAKQDELGICTVCHEPVESRLIEMDYTACVCISHLSDEELRNLENELELAAAVQRSLLPQQPPEIPNLEIAAFSRPAQIVGGDYFDFFTFADDRQGVIISDVAGHGMSSSLIMANLQSILRALAQEHDSPSELVERINRLCIHNIQFTTFVTMFLGAFDRDGHRLTYCNAGHNPPLLLRGGASRNSRIEWLGSTGSAIGLTEEFEYSDVTVELESGDVLLLYTDGVTETTDPLGKFFGRQRLADLVLQDANLPEQDMIQAVRHGLEGFAESATQDDDVTIVVLRVVD
jgi:sigma-B regulation protein RsbU (phosphoserine phosphatase)